MPGPLPKQRGRQRSNRPKGMRVVPGGLVDREVPDPPKGLLKATRDDWKRFWESDLAQLTEPTTDVMALRRLFTLYDQRERAIRSVRKDPFVEGSKGQPVANPMGKRQLELDKEIRQLEANFGLTPKARLTLGIAFGQAAATLDDLNQSINHDDDDDGDEEDPRVAAAQ